MLDVKFTIRAPDWGRFRRSVLDELEAAAKATAQRCVRTMTSNMRSGLDPDGRPQKPNPPGVVEDKEGQPPLVDTGTLSDPSRYSVVPAGSPLSWRVLPPPERRTAIPELRRKGYRLFYIGQPVHDVAGEELREAATAVRRDTLWRSYT